jgi:antitoxin component of RelBE/YafQ-DinJ toxin-antitoxin module
VELNKGIPFEVRVPNAETVQAIRDLEEGRDLVRHRGMKEFKQTLRER